MHESGHALEEVESNTCIPAVLIISVVFVSNTSFIVLNFRYVGAVENVENTEGI